MPDGVAEILKRILSTYDNDPKWLLSGLPEGDRRWDQPAVFLVEDQPDEQHPQHQQAESRQGEMRRDTAVEGVVDAERLVCECTRARRHHERPSANHPPHRARFGARTPKKASSGKVLQRGGLLFAMVVAKDERSKSNCRSS